MKNKNKFWVITLLILVIALLTYIIYTEFVIKSEIVSTPFPEQTILPLEESMLIPNPIPAPTPAPTPMPTKDDCYQKTSYTCTEYQNGWKEAFKDENELSESEFNQYITVKSILLRPTGNTYELMVQYDIKKDWLTVSRSDNMTLGFPISITPYNLPRESDLAVSGRVGVSRINLKDPLVFASSETALAYFIDAEDIDAGTDPKITWTSFQYFWNIEQADPNTYAAEAGDPFIEIKGTVNYDNNECYEGQISLITKETVIWEDVECYWLAD